MNSTKLITVAAVFAAFSTVAQAQGVDQFGRGTPNLSGTKAQLSNNSVATYGRGTPAPGTGVTLPSVGGDVEVARVQGRSSIARNATPGKIDQSITNTASRAVMDVWGRS
jgi:hypothetical protein